MGCNLRSVKWPMYNLVYTGPFTRGSIIEIETRSDFVRYWFSSRMLDYDTDKFSPWKIAT